VISPSSYLSGTCTVAGSTAPLGLAITVQIPFTGGDNVDLYGPVSSNTVVATVTATETLTTQASQTTTIYAQPTSNCAGTAPTETTTTTITVTTTSTTYTQTVTVTSCTYSTPTVTSTVTTTSVLGGTG